MRIFSAATDIDDAVIKKHIQGKDTSFGIQIENLNMGMHKITGLVDPANPQDAATKKYIDDVLAGWYSNKYVSDIAYAASWNGVTNIAPSKNAVYDKIEAIGSASVSDIAYAASWNGVVNIAPSKNAVYDKIEALDISGLDNIVEDLTPQLGGNLDMNNKLIGGNSEAQLDDAISKKHTQGTDTALGAQAEILNMNTHKIIGVVDPTAAQDAATKAYGDAHWTGGGNLPVGDPGETVYKGESTWLTGNTLIVVSSYAGTPRAKIQAAINEAQANGGIVYIPKGNWIVDDHDSDGHCLEITAAVTIIGDNRHNTFVKSADNNASIFHINTNAAVHIRDLCIQNTAASPTTGAHGITVTSSTNNNYSTFADLILVNNDIGIAFLNATHCTVRNCVFSSSNSYGLLINNSYTKDSGEISIIGNLFTGNPDSQIRIESGGGSRLVNNNIWAGSYGVDVAIRNGTSTSVLTMVGNKFEGQYTNSISLRNYPGGSTGIYEKITITGNEFCENCDSHGSTGLSINGYNDSTFRTIAINGNVMRGGGIDVGNCTDIAIVGNVMDKSSVSRSYGINFTAAPAGNIVIGGNSYTGYTRNIGGVAITPTFPCGQVRIQNTIPGFWLDETGTGNCGAYLVLDNKCFQIQQRYQNFGGYVGPRFLLNIETGNLSIKGTLTENAWTLKPDDMKRKWKLMESIQAAYDAHDGSKLDPALRVEGKGDKGETIYGKRPSDFTQIALSCISELKARIEVLESKKSLT